MKESISKLALIAFGINSLFPPFVYSMKRDPSSSTVKSEFVKVTDPEFSEQSDAEPENLQKSFLAGGGKKYSDEEVSGQSVEEKIKKKLEVKVFDEGISVNGSEVHKWVEEGFASTVKITEFPFLLFTKNDSIVDIASSGSPSDCFCDLSISSSNELTINNIMVNSLELEMLTKSRVTLSQTKIRERFQVKGIGDGSFQSSNTIGSIDINGGNWLNEGSLFGNSINLLTQAGKEKIKLVNKGTIKLVSVPSKKVKIGTLNLGNVGLFENSAGAKIKVEKVTGSIESIVNEGQVSWKEARLICEKTLLNGESGRFSCKEGLVAVNDLINLGNMEQPVIKVHNLTNKTDRVSRLQVGNVVFEHAGKFENIGNFMCNMLDFGSYGVSVKNLEGEGGIKSDIKADDVRGSISQLLNECNFVSRKSNLCSKTTRNSGYLFCKNGGIISEEFLNLGTVDVYGMRILVLKNNKDAKISLQELSFIASKESQSVQPKKELINDGLINVGRRVSLKAGSSSDVFENNCSFKCCEMDIESVLFNNKGELEVVSLPVIPKTKEQGSVMAISQASLTSSSTNTSPLKDGFISVTGSLIRNSGSIKARRASINSLDRIDNDGIIDVPEELSLSAVAVTSNNITSGRVLLSCDEFRNVGKLSAPVILRDRNCTQKDGSVDLVKLKKFENLGEIDARNNLKFACDHFKNTSNYVAPEGVIKAGVLENSGTLSVMTIESTDSLLNSSDKSSIIAKDMKVSGSALENQGTILVDIANANCLRLNNGGDFKAKTISGTIGDIVNGGVIDTENQDGSSLIVEHIVNSGKMMKVGSIVAKQSLENKAGDFVAASMNLAGTFSNFSNVKSKNISLASASFSNTGSVVTDSMKGNVDKFLSSSGLRVENVDLTSKNLIKLSGDFSFGIGSINANVLEVSGLFPKTVKLDVERAYVSCDAFENERDIVCNQLFDVDAKSFTNNGRISSPKLTIKSKEKSAINKGTLSSKDLVVEAPGFDNELDASVNSDTSLKVNKSFDDTTLTESVVVSETPGNPAEGEINSKVVLSTKTLSNKGSIKAGSLEFTGSEIRNENEVVLGQFTGNTLKGVINKGSFISKSAKYTADNLTVESGGVYMVEDSSDCKYGNLSNLGTVKIDAATVNNLKNAGELKVYGTLKVENGIFENSGNADINSLNALECSKIGNSGTMKAEELSIGSNALENSNSIESKRFHLKAKTFNNTGKFVTGELVVADDANILNKSGGEIIVTETISVDGCNLNNGGEISLNKVSNGLVNNITNSGVIKINSDIELGSSVGSSVGGNFLKSNVIINTGMIESNGNKLVYHGIPSGGTLKCERRVEVITTDEEMSVETLQNMFDTVSTNSLSTSAKSVDLSIKNKKLHLDKFANVEFDLKSLCASESEVKAHKLSLTTSAGFVMNNNSKVISDAEANFSVSGETVVDESSGIYVKSGTLKSNKRKLFGEFSGLTIGKM